MQTCSIAFHKYLVRVYLVVGSVSGGNVKEKISALTDPTDFSNVLAVRGYLASGSVILWLVTQVFTEHQLCSRHCTGAYCRSKERLGDLFKECEMQSPNLPELLKN